MLMRSIQEKYTGISASFAKKPPMSMSGKTHTGARMSATSGFDAKALITNPKDAAVKTSKYKTPRTGSQTDGSHVMFKKLHAIVKKRVGTKKSKSSSATMRER